MSMLVFAGLSAFPLTPADKDGIVDVNALGVLVDRLARAGVDSISVLGSTGGYAYLDRDQRNRAVATAVEAAAGRVPVVVGVGALRTSWARGLAIAAEDLGASGLLLAPMSYTKLTEREVEDHFQTVASATGLPLAIYNNPGTTNFAFSHAVIARLAALPGIAAVKMPALKCGNYVSEISTLRAGAPARFKIGYSGDWCAAPALLAGADAWHSVIAGILPGPALQLTRAAQAGDADLVKQIDEAFAPLWSFFAVHGSLRLIYDIAEMLGLVVGNPPLPLQRANAEVRAELELVIARLSAL